ncbi:MAG: ABC transporter ATP-binding protein, partial [Brachybacterium sp.]|nr:ABC transporter ATP-binding protein [Brachybacterium sp.]
DAVARRLFFDRLLADFATHPRTVILSTHHIDEVSNLLEHVVLLDEGRVAISAETEELQNAAIEVSGRLDVVTAFLAGADVLHVQEIGSLATATVHAEPGSAERARAAGLQVAPVSLQNYIVHRTTATATAPVA